MVLFGRLSSRTVQDYFLLRGMLREQPFDAPLNCQQETMFHTYCMECLTATCSCAGNSLDCFCEVPPSSSRRNRVESVCAKAQGTQAANVGSVCFAKRSGPCGGVQLRSQPALCAKSRRPIAEWELYGIILSRY